jgi:osmoprotectant transport system substrate-binding protein
MNWKPRYAQLAVAIAALVAVAACGSTSTAGSKGTITIGGFGFSEGSVLAELYGQALQHDGYTIKYKLNLGNREVVGPALKSGQIDMYIGYAATDLEYYNNSAGEATGDATATTAKLNSHLQPLNLVALTPSNTVDQNAFAVTKATADKYNLKNISDLAPVAGQFILGGPPECKTRPFCLPGLEKTYGLHFKDFKTLDADGPLTHAALKNGDIQVGLVFSSDSANAAQGLVVLQDDKHLEAADNVVPILRQAVATDEVKKVLNAISAKLTTPDLISLNDKVENQHVDAEAATLAWLQQNNYGQ